MRGLLSLVLLLLVTTASGYSVFGGEAGRFSAERRLRFCLGEVGVMAPFGIVGRALEFDWLTGGFRLGVSAGEGFSGLNGDYTGTIGPVHVGATLLSRYAPEGRAAVSIRELFVEVGAGIQPALLPNLWWRSSLRGVVDYYSVGLGLEGGVIFRSPKGVETATPYLALLFQLPTGLFPY